MSTIIMSACWELQDMSPAQKAVLISLADQANDQGVCWPSVSTIERRTCLSERAVQDALRWLQATGAIWRDYRQNAASIYTVTPQNFDPSKAPPKRVRKGANGAPGADGAPPGADGAPPSANGAPQEVQMAHQGVANGAPKSSMNRNGNHQLTTNEPSAPGVCTPDAADELAGMTKEQRKQLFQEICRMTWELYAKAYEQRYGAQPVRNAKVNKHVQDLVKRIGREAPEVAAYFVLHINEAFIVRRCHAIGDLLAQCEAFRTQWAVGVSMTQAQAQQADRTQTNLNAASQAAAMAREIIARRDEEAKEEGNAQQQGH